ncbi:MAG TPA: helix-turn-helix transcriptional regulator [Burkholderiales bacterium]|nr:helix-turn-helix transcriptional regulator [Burkholderiales bacterium]
MKDSKLTNKELTLINNIIDKLQIDMEKNNQTLYSLSTTLGFEYQPFYRLIKNKKLPTISTLAMITEHLGCSIEELISDKVYIDIHLINNLKEISTLSSSPKKAKISLPIKDTSLILIMKYLPLK